jgi:predicted ArsR family transcriptional regulator
MDTPPNASPRERVLHRLKRDGPLATADLARALRRTPAAIRLQMQRLEAEGLVTHEARAGRVGRPGRTWSLTEKAAASFRDGHGALAVGLIEAVRALHGDAGLELLVEERVRSQGEQYRARLPGARASLRARVEALAALRREEGYMAFVEPVGRGAWRLVENHCPISEAVRCCRRLCDGELALFRSALGGRVRVEREEHAVNGDRRCSYLVRRA